MDDLEFKAPTFAMKGKRTAEIPYQGSIGAGAFLTLLSGRITYKFRITKFKMIFDEVANNLVQHAWYISRNRNVSTTGPPSGDRLFAPESPTGIFVGRGIIRVVDTNIEVEEEGIFIKLYTYNGLGVAYPISASVTVEEL